MYVSCPWYTRENVCKMRQYFLWQTWLKTLPYSGQNTSRITTKTKKMSWNRSRYYTTTRPLDQDRVCGLSCYKRTRTWDLKSQGTLSLLNGLGPHWLPCSQYENATRMLLKLKYSVRHYSRSKAGKYPKLIWAQL